MGLFGASPSAKEQAKAQKRELKSVSRDLGKDQQFLEQEEKKLYAEVQAAAKRGDEASARILAKQLVHLREQKAKMSKMKSTVTSTCYSAQTMATQSTMMAAMASTTKAMAVTNANMNVNQIQSMMQAYSKESMKMEMGADMVDNAFDDIFEGNEAEESLMMDQIYDEIRSAPKTVASPTSTEITDADLEAKIAALTKG